MNRVASRATHSVWADIERGYTGRAQFGRGDRDDTATGTEVQHPPSFSKLGLFERVDQQLRIMLRRVNTVNI
jgi:hypothetical protein